MPEELVKVKCNRDQVWSFGRLMKDQVVTVTADIAKSMVDEKYGVYVYDNPEDHALKDDGLEKAVAKEPVPETKEEAPAEEEAKETGSGSDTAEGETGEAKEEAPVKSGDKKSAKKKGE